MLQSKEKKEILFYAILTLICGLHSGLNFLFIAIMLLQIQNGYKGFLKMCLWLTLKQNLDLSPFTSVFTGTQINIKLLLLTVGAILILANYLQYYEGKIPYSCALVSLFGISALVSAVLYGSYPIAGMIKVLSFTIILLAVIVAVLESHDTFDFETYLYYVLSGIMIASFATLFYGGAYLQGSAGNLFKGMWNHPNDFGVICAIYLSIALIRCARIGYIQGIQMIMVMVMIYSSRSRGAMIALIGILVMYFIFCEKSSDRIIIGTIFMGIFFALLFTKLGVTMEQFFLKGSKTISTDLFSSRDEIKTTAMNRFNSNKLFGRGLLIPYEPGTISYSFNENATEPGNIFYELLAGTGVVGVFWFIGMILYFFIKGIGKQRIYVIAVILASISEVSFFSVNNYACLYYFLLAFCIMPLDKYNKN